MISRAFAGIGKCSASFRIYILRQSFSVSTYTAETRPPSIGSAPGQYGDTIEAAAAEGKN